MSAARGPGPLRRAVVGGLVVACLALVAVASAARVGRRTTGTLAPGPSDASAASVASPATSAAWYCAGPLPVGARPEASSIAIANVGDRALRGEVRLSESTGRSLTVPVAVGPSDEAVVGLPRSGRRAFAAATVLVDGASVGVEELIHGPAGPVASPCVSEAGTEQLLAAGSTAGADDVALALYVPGATPGVASVTVHVGSQALAPPAFQGIPVAAGGLVVLNVGHYVSGRQLLALAVTSTGGRVVAGALEVHLVGRALVSALVPGALAPRTTWYFPGAPAAGAARQALDVYNPGPRPARVLVASKCAAGSPATTVTVGPGAVVEVPAAPGPLRWTLVTSTNGVGIVAQRAATVSRALVPPPRHAGPSLTALPPLRPGFGLTTGTAAAHERWLVPGGESDRHASVLLSVSNPSRRALTFTVERLAGPSVGGMPAPAALVVPAQGTTVVDLAQLVGARAPVLPLVVTASGPVVVGSLLYSRGSGQALGFSAPLAIPVE
ncbi:MAG TPA: DUF5719 family protein [Acidimicrobiales bacterium]|nr:DUF5719 family protein [Acidimicrobiales bacterium]